MAAEIMTTETLNLKFGNSTDSEFSYLWKLDNPTTLSSRSQVENVVLSNDFQQYVQPCDKSGVDLDILLDASIVQTVVTTTRLE